MRSILDFNVALDGVADRHGAEPTLRQLIFKYYTDNISDELLSIKLAHEYVAQILEREAARMSDKALSHFLASAKADLLAANKWQPIDTAPKYSDFLVHIASGYITIGNRQHWTIQSRYKHNTYPLD